jgi:hypothetical protein
LNYDAATKRHVIGPMRKDSGNVNGVMISEGERRERCIEASGLRQRLFAVLGRQKSDPMRSALVVA